MTRRKDGRWCQSVQIDNERFFVYSSAPDERSAQREINRKIMDLKKRRSGSVMFETVAREWADEHFPTLEAGSVKAYRPALDDVLAEFAGRRISEIKAADLDAFLRRYARAKTTKTVKTRHGVLNMIFRHAAVRGYIESSPMAFVAAPKGAVPAKKRTALTSEEIKAVVDHMGDGEVGFLGAFLLLTGCRRGEALALKYSDVDFDARTVRVNKTLEWHGNAAAVKDHPKTEAGVRLVPLPEILLSALPRKRSGLLFPDQTGKVLSNAGVSRIWKKWQKLTGLDEVTPHMLRHTYATILYSSGVDVKAAQAFLGHADVNTTLGIYTHLSEEHRRQEARKLDALKI